MSVGWDYKHQRRFMISKMGIGVYKFVCAHVYVHTCIDVCGHAFFMAMYICVKVCVYTCTSPHSGLSAEEAKKQPPSTPRGNVCTRNPDFGL